MNTLIKGVSKVGSILRYQTTSAAASKKVPLWKELDIQPPHHGDFRPDLLQETSIFHYQMPQYQKCK